MPGTFAYTPASKTVQVIAGTSGAPTTPLDYVAADRGDSALTAGVGASLKAATVAAAGMTLTYPVRPVDQRALRLTFITAAAGGAAASGDESLDIYGTTFQWTTFSADEAAAQTVLSVVNASIFKVGDVVRLIDISAPATTETATISAISLAKGANTITVDAITNAFVAGDIVGLNQTETIDTSAGHGTFVTTKAFGQLAYFDCNGYDGTNTVAVTQPIWGAIWDLGGDAYKIDCPLVAGDGSTSTYFAGEGYHLILDNKWQTSDWQGFITGRTAATFRLGKVLDATTKAVQLPSSVHFYYSVPYYHYGLNTSGTPVYELYGTSFTQGGPYSRYCQLYLGLNANSKCWNTSTFGGYLRNLAGDIFNHLAFGNLYGLRGPITGVTIDKTILLKNTYAFSLLNDSDGVTVNNLYARGSTVLFNLESITGTKTFYLKDADSDIWTYNVTGAGTAYVYRQYPCNISVADKDGTLLDGVTVLCQDKDGTQVFSVQTGAVETGMIVEQTINYIRYEAVNTVKDSTTYSPHKFTVSLTGYETKVIPNITVDGAIGSPTVPWEIQLKKVTQSISASPSLAPLGTKQVGVIS